MRGFGCPVIEAQIVAAGCLQPFVPKNLLDMPHRTAIEEKLGCSRMPQQMGCDALTQARKNTVTGEGSPDICASKAPKSVACHKERRITIASCLKISADPN